MNPLTTTTTASCRNSRCWGASVAAMRKYESTAAARQHRRAARRAIRLARDVEHWEERLRVRPCTNWDID